MKVMEKRKDGDDDERRRFCIFQAQKWSGR